MEYDNLIRIEFSFTDEYGQETRVKKSFTDSILNHFTTFELLVEEFKTYLIEAGFSEKSVEAIKIIE